MKISNQRLVDEGLVDNRNFEMAPCFRNAAQNVNKSRYCQRLRLRKMKNNPLSLVQYPTIICIASPGQRGSEKYIK